MHQHRAHHAAELGSDASPDPAAPPAPAPGGPSADAVGAPGAAGEPPPNPPVPPSAEGVAPTVSGAIGASGCAVPPPRAAVSTPRAGAPRTVRRSSVRGQVLAKLRAALVSGELEPGEVYSAPVLGERLGVSATPVREAMHRLASEGAVEVVPNRGFRVAERDARELAELAEVRALIEVPVLLRLARTARPEDWAALRPLAEETAAVAARGDRAAYAEADRAFHRALLALAGNGELVRLADGLHCRAQWPLAAGPPLTRLGLLADAAEHTALLDALAAGDLTTVESLAREHFTGAED